LEPFQTGTFFVVPLTLSPTTVYIKALWEILSSSCLY